MCALFEYTGYITLFILYIAVGIIVYGNYSKKWAGMGLDGLVPIFASIFWPLTFIINIIVSSIKALYNLGRII